MVASRRYIPTGAARSVLRMRCALCRRGIPPNEKFYNVEPLDQERVCFRHIEPEYR